MSSLLWDFLHQQAWILLNCCLNITHTHTHILQKKSCVITLHWLTLMPPGSTCLTPVILTQWVVFALAGNIELMFTALRILFAFKKQKVVVTNFKGQVKSEAAPCQPPSVFTHSVCEMQNHMDSLWFSAETPSCPTSRFQTSQEAAGCQRALCAVQITLSWNSQYWYSAVISNDKPQICKTTHFIRLCYWMWTMSLKEETGGLFVLAHCPSGNWWWQLYVMVQQGDTNKLITTQRRAWRKPAAVCVKPETQFDEPNHRPKITLECL